MLLLKGSNMTVCVLLGVKLPWVLCCLAVAGDHWRDNTRGSLTPTIHTQSCLIPIITWCHHLSPATNILLMKSNLKFESRATAVSVAMSPRYRGGKYHSRLQVGMFFDGIACLTKVWPLFKREFPRVPRTWRSARARANFKCDVADVNK